ncbi:MAG: hypothetical protein P8L85_21310 [Rubripirellula sp.]|nr:hypothetical protein [Rubripirellula sp.]
MLIPFFVFPLLVVMSVVAWRSPPRPYTLMWFFGIQFAAFFVDVSFWGNGIRFLLAVATFALAIMLEVACRKLPRGQMFVAVSALIVSIAWYIAVICVCESASV